MIITAVDASGQALAMTVGSFVSVSLEPALIGFLPAKTSSSWASLRTSGTTNFAINVLGSHQEDVCRLRSRARGDKDPHESVMLNSNKTSVALDLKREEGKDVLLRLVDKADVLIENYAPGPWTAMPAMDLTAQAMPSTIPSTLC